MKKPTINPTLISQCASHTAIEIIYRQGGGGGEGSGEGEGSEEESVEGEN